MIRSKLARIRRRVGLGLLTFLAAWVVWTQTPGMPVRHAPRASAAVKEAGLTLFEHEWKPGDPLAKGDGLGPVFNERSCVACHFQGGVGGGGDTKQNVTAFEIHPVPGRPEVMGGMIHRFALSKDCRESRTGLNDFFAVVPGGVKIVGTCFVETRDFDPVRTQSINPTALYGAGWIDRISAKTIVHQSRRKALQAIGKELLADLDGVKPGPGPRAGGWPDRQIWLEGPVRHPGRVRRFRVLQRARPGQPRDGTGQAVCSPGGHRRLIPTWTRTNSARWWHSSIPCPARSRSCRSDPKERGQCRARQELVRAGWLRGLPYAGDRGRGGHLQRLPVASSHQRERSGERLCRGSQVPLPDGHPLPDEWKTPPLWGVADSAPYFHDGGSPTLEAAILRHQRRRGRSSPRPSRPSQATIATAIVRFLKSLKAPVEAKPAESRPRAMIASR